MAKFRRHARRTFTRKVRRSHSGKSSGLNPLMVIIPAAAYGALREQVSQLIAPLTSKIPLGQYADEVVFAGLGYLAAKKGKGMVKGLGYGMLSVEFAALGSQVFGSMGQSGTTMSNSVVAYGGWI